MHLRPSSPSSLIQYVTPSFSSSSLKSVSLGLLSLGGLGTVGAQTCSTTVIAYDYCFTGIGGSAVGNFATTTNWKTPNNTSLPNFNATTTDKKLFLVSGPNASVTVDGALLTNTGARAATFYGNLRLEDGARLIWNDQGRNVTFANRVRLEGTPEHITTLDFRKVDNSITGSIAYYYDSSIYMENYSRLRYDNPFGTNNDMRTILTPRLRLRGQELFFDVTKDSTLTLPTQFFGVADDVSTFENYTAPYTDTLFDINGDSMRTIHFNQGNDCPVGETCDLPNLGTLQVHTSNVRNIGQWILYGGSLSVSSGVSLGKRNANQSAQIRIRIDPNDERLTTFYSMKSFNLDVLGSATSFTNDIWIENPNTVANFNAKSSLVLNDITFSGAIQGEGSLAIRSDYTTRTQFIFLNPTLTYQGSTYLGVNNSMRFGKFNSTEGRNNAQNLVGNIYFGVGSRIFFLNDNILNVDITYDRLQVQSEAERATGNFKHAQLILGLHNTLANPINTPINSFIEKDISVGLLGSNNSFNVSLVDPGTPIHPNALSLADGVYGAKYMILPNSGSNDPQYVASQADFMFSEFASTTPWNFSGLTASSTVADWQNKINTEAASTRKFGIGSTLTLNHQSIIGAPGVIDSSDDELIFAGSIKPGNFEGDTKLLSPLNNGTMAVSSLLLKKGNGHTVITTPNFTYYEAENLQQQLNVNVQEGILDWRVNGAYSGTGRNPNEIIIQGNYQTQAGATTAVSDVATFLRIQKQPLNIKSSTLISPNGIYMPGSGNFILAGYNTPNPSGMFDPNDPANANRSTLSVLVGGGHYAEIYVEGQASIKGALLQLSGIGSTENTSSVSKSSTLNGTQYTIIHASEGFKGAEFDGGTNGSAVFANQDRPAALVDYLTGGSGGIYNCNQNIGAKSCLINASTLDDSGRNDASLKAQEYIVAGLELSWKHNGSLPSITGDFTIAPTDTFEVDEVLADRAANDPNRQGDGLFHSDYGTWDGKTLTKKGAGTLYLSDNNTYTGGTNIEQGVLSISKDSNLGNASGDVHLGYSLTGLNATLRIEPALTPTTGGVNDSNTLTTNRDFFLGKRNDNTIEVVRADDTFTIQGNIQPNISTATTPSGLRKNGEGHLVLAPTGLNKKIQYAGDTQVLQGSLTIKNNVGDSLSGLTGNFYNSGILEFDTTQGAVTLVGDVNGAMPLPIVAEEDPGAIVSLATNPILGSSYVIKSGANTLTLAGSSEQNWWVKEGNVITSAERFKGNILLEPNQTFSFKQSAGNINSYDGIFYGESNSKLLVEGDGTLDFKYSSGSQVWDVEVGSNPLINTTLIVQARTDGSSTPNPFHVLGNYTTKKGSTTELANENSYLAVDGHFEQETDAHLKVVLDINNLNNPDIIANTAVLKGTVEVNGFSRRILCSSLSGSTDCALTGPNGAVVKASELDGIFYPLLQTNGPGSLIVDSSLVSSGSGDPSVNHPLDGGFLVFGGKVSSTPTNEFYAIDSPSLAWTYTANPSLQNGTFDLASGGSFNVDKILTNQTNGSGGAPNVAWDGKTLQKKGSGLLILSYNPYSDPINPQNNQGYHGNTLITEGSLLIQEHDQILANSPNVILGDTGHLQVGIKTLSTGGWTGTTQTFHNLQTDSMASNGGTASSLDFINTADDNSPVLGGTVTLTSTQDNSFGGSFKGKGNIEFDLGKDSNNINHRLTLTGNLRAYRANEAQDGNLKLLTGDVLLDGQNTYQATEVDFTNSNCASDTCLNGNMLANSGTTLTVTNGAALLGSGTLIGAGSTQGMKLDTLVLNNQGNVGFTTPTGTETVGRNLTVADLVGFTNNAARALNTPTTSGNIVLNTQLGSDQSPTDQLVLTSSVTGKTGVIIRNAKGIGAQTEKGIQIIDAQTHGVVTTNENFFLNSTTKNNSGIAYVTAGAYDYYLYRGGQAGNSNNWYLRSQLNGVMTPSGISSLADALPGIVNRYGLSTLGTYHDRVGASTKGLDHPVWGRALGESGRERNQEDRRSPNYNFDTVAFQFGANFYEQASDAHTSDIAGAFITLGRSSSRVDKNTGELAGKVNLNHISLGGYYTHHFEEGLYIDTTAQLTHTYQIKGSLKDGSSFDNRAFEMALSGEVGYSYPLSDTWKIEPQAQVIFQHNRVNNSSDSQGNILDFGSLNHITGRVGAELSFANVGADNQNHHQINGFIRTNLWHSFNGETSTSVNGATLVPTKLGKTWAQLGFGLSDKISDTIEVFGRIDYNHTIEGGRGNSISGQIGVKVAF